MKPMAAQLIHLESSSPFSRNRSAGTVFAHTANTKADAA